MGRHASTMHMRCTGCHKAQPHVVPHTVRPGAGAPSSAQAVAFVQQVDQLGVAVVELDHRLAVVIHLLPPRCNALEHPWIAKRDNGSCCMLHVAGCRLHVACKCCLLHAAHHGVHPAPARCMLLCMLHGARLCQLFNSEHSPRINLIIPLKILLTNNCVKLQAAHTRSHVRAHAAACAKRPGTRACASPE